MENKEIKNNNIIPKTINHFFYKIKIFKEKEKEKPTKLHREDKLREFLYEKEFAFFKIKKLNFYFKNFKNLKIFSKTINFLSKKSFIDKASF